MGRQGGMGRFLGSIRQLVGYVDDGKAIWRRNNPVSSKKWHKLACFAGQRRAARYFGAASAVAGDLWSKLPAGMRRLADGGGFNRLVGLCRDLMEEDGQVWNLDDLAGLDLSVDSSGPLSVSGSVSEGLRLSGVRELMLGIDAAVGPGAGETSEKYVMANRHVNDGKSREYGDYGPLGECVHWRGKFKENGRRKTRPEFRYGTEKTARREYSWSRVEHVLEPLPPGLPYTHWTAPERRVRVWVYASEIADTCWNELHQTFELTRPALRRGRGFVTDWLVGSRFPDPEKRVFGWLPSYLVDGELVLPPMHDDPERPDLQGTGIFVVFTAVEVAEKRGRHWVRLPWCSRMQVHSVVDNWDLPLAAADYVEVASELRGGELRAAPGRRVEGMDVDYTRALEKALCAIDEGQLIIDNFGELRVESGELRVAELTFFEALSRAGP